MIFPLQRSVQTLVCTCCIRPPPHVSALLRNPAPSLAGLIKDDHTHAPMLYTAKPRSGGPQINTKNII